MKTAAILLVGLLPALAGAAAPAAVCRVRAEGAPPRVVELYTSEGCNSCPPADRWLGTLRERSDVLAAAFHVDYWDRLGWRDRFASPAYTARQAAQVGRSGARFAYTPQVLVDGRDWRDWPQLPAAQGGSGVAIDLERQGERATLRVTPGPGAPAQLGLWWALLEDGHHSEVKAGENAGVRLQHDRVVRRHGTLPNWAGQAGVALSTTLDVPRQGEAGRTTQLMVIVHEAATGRTLQATQLACGSSP